MPAALLAECGTGCKALLLGLPCGAGLPGTEPAVKSAPRFPAQLRQEPGPAARIRQD